MPFDAIPGAIVGRLLSLSCNGGSYPQASEAAANCGRKVTLVRVDEHLLLKVFET